MKNVINARELRAHLSEVVNRVRKGGRLTVLYRSRPAFDIVPVGETPQVRENIENDALYRAKPVGSSKDGRLAEKHDEVLYS